MTASALIIDEWFTTSDGVALHSVRLMPRVPPRAAVVVVHGFGEHVGSFSDALPVLAGEDRAAFAYDARGHGRSPGARGHLDAWETFPADLSAFLGFVRERAGAAPIFLLGDSLGTITVLDLALREPACCRGAIVCGAPLGAVGASPIVIAVARALARLAPRLPLNPRLDLTNISRDEARAHAYVNDGVYHQRATSRGIVVALDAIASVRARAGELRTPLLMLHGSADVIARPDAAFFDAAGSADKTRRVYDGARHNLFQETNREEVLRDIASWIDARR